MSLRHLYRDLGSLQVYPDISSGTAYDKVFEHRDDNIGYIFMYYVGNNTFHRDGFSYIKCGLSKKVFNAMYQKHGKDHMKINFIDCPNSYIVVEYYDFQRNLHGDPASMIIDMEELDIDVMLDYCNRLFNRDFSNMNILYQTRYVHGYNDETYINRIKQYLGVPGFILSKFRTGL